MAACPVPPFDETRWMVRIRRIFDEEIELSEDQPIAIFDVPKPLLSTKPEAYTPQLVAIGPYHHCREELCDMERYKLSAAKRAQIHLPGTDFQHLVDIFTQLEHPIRAHYHRHLNLSNETLGWMMAIDVSFLLEFLQTFSKNSNNHPRAALQRVPSRMSHLVDPSRGTSSRSMLLRDVVMLENQIPLFLLLKAVEARCSSAAQSELSSMLIGFFQEVSTFRGIGCPCTDTGRHLHLLAFLYANMTPRCREEPRGATTGDATAAGDEEHDHKKSTLGSVKGLLVRRGSELASMVAGFVVAILLRFVASLPGLSLIGQPIEQLVSHQAAAESRGPSSSSSSDVQKNTTMSPLLEEIAVPSVAELAYTGVRFCPTVGDLSMIDFCAATATLHLPVIGVDANSEVVLRNLVAYEAASAGGSSASSAASALALARYVELMNGIIDTEEDARVLRECGVILNHLWSDREVAELWNGMTRSVRLTRVPALDRVIDDLNRHYSGCWKVRVRRFVKAHVPAPRDLVACVAVVLMLLFVGLQAFCVARGCAPVAYGMASRKFGTLT